jgi:hypothetical protein
MFDRRQRARPVIRLERIAPGHPQQNGRHERMHRTLKLEATKPAAPNVLQQQARFDTFVARYSMKVPADLYTRSLRVYRGLENLNGRDGGIRTRDPLTPSQVR